MSTFNITLHAKETQEEENKNLGKEIEERENNDDTQEEKKASLPELNDHIKTKEEELKNKKLVLMDGPLSKIYTEALNIVFEKENVNKEVNISKESSAIDSALATEYVSNREELPKGMLYVYATDDKDLEKDVKGSISNISKLLNNKPKDSDLYVSVESKKSLNEHVVRFSNYCAVRKCKLFTTRDGCLRSIISKVKGY